MSDDADSIPQTLVGISFGDSFRAQEFLTAATRLASNEQVKLRDAVIVRKDDEGRTTVTETTDLPAGRTAMSGAIWAGLIGAVLGGPVGWVAGTAIGAGAGVATAKIVDIGISDEWVEWFREAVQPGTSTVAILLEDVNTDALVAEAARFTGAHLVYANLDPHTIDKVTEALGDDDYSG